LGGEVEPWNNSKLSIATSPFQLLPRSPMMYTH
jgi:hypothetical protein